MTKSWRGTSERRETRNNRWDSKNLNPLDVLIEILISRTNETLNNPRFVLTDYGLEILEHIATQEQEEIMRKSVQHDSIRSFEILRFLAGKTSGKITKLEVSVFERERDQTTVAHFDLQEEYRRTDLIGFFHKPDRSNSSGSIFIPEDHKKYLRNIDRLRPLTHLQAQEHLNQLHKRLSLEPKTIPKSLKIRNK